MNSERSNYVIKLRAYFAAYGGIILGGLYGLLMRVIFEVGFRGKSYNFSDLFSVTFFWILPIVIGLTPLIFSSKEDLEDMQIRMFRPVYAVFIFFVFCFTTRLEDLVCIIIIALPFLLATTLAAALLGHLILRYRKNKGILYSLFFLPFLSGFIEPLFPTPLDKFELSSSIIINADKSEVWNNVVRVDPIQPQEYKRGFFNYAGVPRPLYAELDKDTLGGTRTGHFEGGLMFRENIRSWEKYKSITFDIQIIPSAVHRTIFERHMLDGEHFRFLDATYTLNEIAEGKTELILTTKYQLYTKINFYGSFWGEVLLSDFQERLIDVIKVRCEK